MEEFVKYIKSLEQRLAALEAAEAKEAAQEAQIAELAAKITELEARIAELEARPAAVVEVETEPEVEVEFEWGEDEDDDETELSSYENETPQGGYENEVEPEPVKEPEVKVEPEKPAATFSASIGAPVDDIRKAISLGDRFLFVRELFGGKGEALQVVIDELNKMSSIEEANAYLDSHFQWDKEAKSYELFQNVLKRRFC